TYAPATGPKRGCRLRQGVQGKGVWPRPTGPNWPRQPIGSSHAMCRRHPPDWLARATRDLLNVLDEIGKQRAGFKSLKDTWADSTTAHGRLAAGGTMADVERS